MKWINNGIQYKRGCYECLIAQFNHSGCWFSLKASATQQTQKSEFKRLAEYLDDDITVCEVKNLYDENDEITVSENEIVDFLFRYDGTCCFYDADGKKINI